MGCQGEVGSACSMAAAGLAEALGGTPEQVENAAEIGMEHNLGLTCDPVGGLVRSRASSATRWRASRRSPRRGWRCGRRGAPRVAGQGHQDHAETGADMKVKYKETARGGLAVNVIEC
ncbi:L-serine ammonia-lyase, iron-sulfur-dependent, subunit alpha [Micromonospora sp. BRA006-A]|nr:L-serine ammonia-lyase, iron-sulfur-dependent, subunit alpha [Micromonospora sp. BRA006-A]